MLGFQVKDKDESSREIAVLLSNARLNHPIEKSKVDELTQIHSGFRRVQAELISSLQKGMISPDEYLHRFNSALRDAMVMNERVLGHQDFLSVFGEAGQSPEGLVDAETFYSETRNGPPKLRAR